MFFSIIFAYRKIGFVYNLSLVGSFATGNDQVKYYAHKRREANASDGEATQGEFGSTDTQCEDERCNDQIASVAQVYLVLDEAVHTHRGDGSKE